MDILEHLRARRAELAAAAVAAANHHFAIQGGLAELDLLIGQLAPKVNIVMLPPDDEEPAGNQQYDLNTLKVDEPANEN